MPTSELIRKNLSFCTDYKVGVVSYCLKGKNTGDIWQQALLIFNANRENITLTVPEARYKLIAYGDVIDEEGIEYRQTSQAEAAPISMTLLVRESERSQ